MVRGEARSVLAREWPFILVCLGVCLGLGVVVVLDRFRRGTLVLAVAVIMGAAFRLVLPNGRSGLLRVRGRTFDVATLLVLGVAMIVVALAVPPPS